MNVCKHIMAVPLQCPPDLEKLLKDVKLTVADGARLVTEDEMNAMMKEGQQVQGQPEFISNDGRIEAADKWAQTTPTKLAGTPDSVMAGDQKYYALSYTLPGVQIGEQASCDKLAVKVGGAFVDIPSGRGHLKGLHKARPEFDVTLEKLYEWTAVSDGTVLRHETRVDALTRCMTWYHKQQQEYRHKQLERMQEVKQAASKGEKGPIHEDYKDIHTEVSYGEMDPESDDPRLLEDRPKPSEDDDCVEIQSDDSEGEQEEDGDRRKVLKMQPDPDTVGGLEWCVFSYIIPGDTEEEQAASRCMAFKNSGCFRTAEEADSHAGVVMDMNPFFGSKVVRMYNWIELPVSSETEKKIKHRSKDKVHEEIMGEYYGTERSQKISQIVETIELVKAKEAEERAAKAKAEAEAEAKEKANKTERHIPLADIAVH